jgi:peptide/nickel transport system permease protein
MAVFTHPVVRFIARRLLYSLVVLVGVLVVVFALVHLVPGDPVRIALGTRYTPEAYDALRSASGLDRPIVEQFFGYIGSALTGNLGVSFRNGDPVTLTLLERLPATVSLGLVGIVIALLIALPAGIWSALHEGRVSDAIVRVTSQFGVSIPDFWLGILLITAGVGFVAGGPALTPLPETAIAVHEEAVRHPVEAAKPAEPAEVRQ